MYIFLYAKLFPYNWKCKLGYEETSFYQINECIQRLGDNLQSVMSAYFNECREKMHKQYMIPPQLVEKYHDDLIFLFDSDNSLIQVVNPRVI